VSLPFLFEIGVEEIPDWMIPDALENLRVLFEKLEIPHESVTLDAPRAASCCAPKVCPRGRPIARSACSVPPNRPHLRPSRASRANRV